MLQYLLMFVNPAFHCLYVLVCSALTNVNKPMLTFILTYL